MPNRPERLHLLDDRGRELVGVLELGRDRDHLAGDEAAHGLDQLAADLGIGRRRSCGARYACVAASPRPGRSRGDRYRARPDDEPHARSRASAATKRCAAGTLNRADAAAGPHVRAARTGGMLIGFIIAVVVDAIVMVIPPLLVRALIDTRAPRQEPPPRRACSPLVAVGARVRRRDALARSSATSRRAWARASSTTCGSRSSTTCSGCRSRSSPARRPARCSRG